MKRVMLFGLFTLCAYAARNSTHNITGCMVADIVVVCDWSGSIRNSEYFQKEAIADFANSFRLSEDGIRFGVIDFADSATVSMPLSANEESLALHLWSIRDKRAEGGTFLGPALDSLIGQMKSFNLGGRGRTYVPKIAIIISDGQPTEDHENIYTQAEELKEVHGVKIFCIFAKSINDDYRNDYLLEKIASPDCFLRTDFEGLKSTLQQLDMCM